MQFELAGKYHQPPFWHRWQLRTMPGHWRGPDRRVAAFCRKILLVLKASPPSGVDGTSVPTGPALPQFDDWVAERPEFWGAGRAIQQEMFVEMLRARLADDHASDDGCLARGRASGAGIEGVLQPVA